MHASLSADTEFCFLFAPFADSDIAFCFLSDRLPIYPHIPQLYPVGRSPPVAVSSGRPELPDLKERTRRHATVKLALQDGVSLGVACRFVLVHNLRSFSLCPRCFMLRHQQLLAPLALVDSQTWGKRDEEMSLGPSQRSDHLLASQRY